ncbi:MAG: ammonium transporter, partial [Planctomycetaceae bacterium]|nr:ammonium transporter [Planctomycetaceae bacterium]
MNFVRNRWLYSLLFGAVLSVSVGGIINSLAPAAIAQESGEQAASTAKESAENPATEEKAAEEASPAKATDSDATAEALASYIQETDYTINTLIMFICAVLVIFMQAGFAMVEIGLNSAKNAVNILSKNVMDLCVGVLLYLFIGFNLMYPGDAWTVDGYLGSF